MTRVDFYVVPEDSPEDALPTACKLCEKAVASGKRVHVHVPDSAQAEALDKLLWTYKQGGFLAHQRAGTDGSELAAVVIGDAPPKPPQREVLLNLAAAVPPFFQSFERVLEIVAGDTAARNKSRARFKAYRDQGAAPETIRL